VGRGYLSGTGGTSLFLKELDWFFSGTKIIFAPNK
jgi:hypothetical protein